MPREILTGFFGKLPSTGDFVSRGLPPGFRTYWDGWCSKQLLPRLSMAKWPEGGLRLRLVSGGKVAAGVVVPGQDSAGRKFPLAVFAIADALPDPVALNPWCDRIAETLTDATRNNTSPDQLWDALEALEPPDGDDGAVTSHEMRIWDRNRGAETCDPDDPQTLLNCLTGVSCC